MPRYSLVNHFDHIKGDSWSQAQYRYTESFLKETDIDYQISRSRNLAVIEEEGQEPKTYPRRGRRGFQLEHIGPINQYDPHCHNSDPTSLSLRRHHWFDVYLELEDWLDILDAKAKRLTRDFDSFQDRVINAWKVNSYKQIGIDFLRGVGDLASSGLAYHNKLVDHCTNWTSNPELLKIKEQLSFEREVFYWSNIREFEEDYNRIFRTQTILQARDSKYDEPYQTEEGRLLCERACGFVNPFVYPSEDYYRYWSEQRDSHYFHNASSNDPYWTIEADYHKQLVFCSPWIRFLTDHTFGTVPDDFKLRKALDQDRNSE